MGDSSFLINSIVLAHKFKAPPFWYSAEYAKTRTRHGLVYVLSGSADYEMVEGESFTAVKDDILYMPEGTKYLIHCGEEPFLHMTINFKLEGNIALPRRRACEDSENTRSDMSRLIVTWNNRRDNYREKCIGLLYLLICSQLKNNNSETKNSLEKIKSALSVFNEEESFKKEIRVSDLARSCCMSEVYFRRLFFRAFGKTPGEYITDMRMSYACELMKNTNLSVEDICYESGYRDPSYFSRAFRKYTGMPPTLFREQNID